MTHGHQSANQPYSDVKCSPAMQHWLALCIEYLVYDLVSTVETISQRSVCWGVVGAHAYSKNGEKQNEAGEERKLYPKACSKQLEGNTA